jgi:hypothetical protein
MKRRGFLKKALLTVAAVPVLGATVYWIKQRSPQDYFLVVIRQQLPYLQFSEEMVAQFTQDYLQHHAKQLGISESAVQFLSSFEDWLKVIPLLKQQLGELEQQVARDFLLSTDFFQQGADVGSPVQYLGVYSPYLRPCAHPFMNFV